LPDNSEERQHKKFKKFKNSPIKELSNEKYYV
jgi:hypothetical protein